MLFYHLLPLSVTDSQRTHRQLGVVKYLQQHFDLSKVQLRGASAGGLVATLCACNVDPERAVRLHAHACSCLVNAPDAPYERSKVWAGLTQVRAQAGVRARAGEQNI